MRSFHPASRCLEAVVTADLLHQSQRLGVALALSDSIEKKQVKLRAIGMFGDDFGKTPPYVREGLFLGL